MVSDNSHFELRQVLNALLDWAAQMGGFEAPVWDRARAYRDSLFPLEVAERKQFRVIGQVFLADGFDIVVEVNSEAEAERTVRAWAHDAEWKSAEIHEVCIQSTVEEPPPTGRRGNSDA